MPQRCQRCLASVEQLFGCGRLSLCERCTAIAAQTKKKVKKKKASVTSTAELRQLTNDAFAEYYKEQLRMSGEEWEEFERCLRSPLPVTWRFSGQGEAALALCASMERRILPALEEQEQPSPLPWYPARLGWQTRVSRAAAEFTRYREAVERRLRDTAPPPPAAFERMGSASARHLRKKRVLSPSVHPRTPVATTRRGYGR